MSTEESTCWTVIAAAAAGCTAQRAAFAQRYQPVIRALAARWQNEAAATFSTPLLPSKNSFVAG